MPHAETSSGRTQPATQVPSLFDRLRAKPGGGLCLQAGCQDIEFTVVLTRLFDHVLAVDTSPAAIEAGRTAVAREGITNIDFQLVQKGRLDGVADEIADSVVECGFLEQLDRKKQIVVQLNEFARVLRRRGQAYVTVPLLARGLKGLLRPPWLTAISERQLALALSRAGLTVCASDEASSHRSFTRELLLHLEHDH